MTRLTTTAQLHKPWPSGIDAHVSVKSLSYEPIIYVSISYGDIADARMSVQLSLDEARHLVDRLNQHIGWNDFRDSPPLGEAPQTNPLEDA